jgi:hypothetical protein
MRKTASPCHAPALHGLSWILLIALAEGAGCGRTGMGDSPVVLVGSGGAQAGADADSRDGRADGATDGMGEGRDTTAASSGGAGGQGTGGTGAGGTGGASTKPKPLWRDSYDAFCPGTASIFADVWGDDRGVFVLSSDDKNNSAIWSNVGTGWRTAFAWPEGTNNLYQGGLTGIPGGPLVVYGGFPCGIQFVEGGGVSCSGAATFVEDLKVLDAKLAYAVSYDRVLTFDGDLWTQLGDPLPGVSVVRAVWADSSTVVAAADGGHVFAIPSGGTPVSLSGLSSQVDTVAAWGFGASDLWIGSAKGQLFHYDGAQWSQKATIPYAGSGSLRLLGTDGIGKLKLWGKDGSLFFVAGNVFGRWDGSGVRTLDTLEGKSYFAGLWGNSPSEIFLAVHDVQPSVVGCGQLRTRWFDGSKVGPL